MKNGRVGALCDTLPGQDVEKRMARVPIGLRGRARRPVDSNVHAVSQRAQTNSKRARWLFALAATARRSASWIRAARKLNVQFIDAMEKVGEEV